MAAIFSGRKRKRSQQEAVRHWQLTISRMIHHAASEPGVPPESGKQNRVISRYETAGIRAPVYAHHWFLVRNQLSKAYGSTRGEEKEEKEVKGEPDTGLSAPMRPLSYHDTQVEDNGREGKRKGRGKEKRKGKGRCLYMLYTLPRVPSLTSATLVVFRNFNVVIGYLPSAKSP